MKTPNEIVHRCVEVLKMKTGFRMTTRTTDEAFGEHLARALASTEAIQEAQAWLKEQEAICPACDGAGGSNSIFAQVGWHPCPACKGTGRR